MFSRSNHTIKNLLSILFLIIGISSGIAQTSSVSITVNVLPPYSNKYSDYLDNQNKIMVTLISNAPEHIQVWLQGSITSDNGISLITDPNKKSPTPIDLYPGVPKIIDRSNITDIFDKGRLILTGITEQELVRANALPEGTYTICLRAYDFITDEPLSAEEPSGCSAPFNIADIEAPFILKPFCEDKINPTTPQNVIFTWSIPVGAPVTTQFKIKIADVIPIDRNPAEAMTSVGIPYFFEQNITGNVFVYGPAQPQLVKGHVYAFSITAIDPSGQTKFKNNGESEVCSFQYGENTGGGTNTADINQTNVDTTTSSGGGYIPFTIPNLIVPTSPVISGKLTYKYQEDGSGDVLKNTKIKIVDQLFLKTSDGKMVCVAPGSEFFMGNTYSTLNSNYSEMLGKLQNFYYSSSDDANDAYYAVLAIGYTDASGNFSIPAPLPFIWGLVPNKYGKIINNVKVVFTGLPRITIDQWGKSHQTEGEKTEYVGDIYRVIRVMVESPYYYSPSYDIIPQANVSTINIGTQFAYVRSYTAKLKMTSGYGTYNNNYLKPFDPIPGMIGEAYRVNTPVGLPNLEGNMSYTKKIDNKYKVISEFESGSDGYVYFKKLVKNYNVEAYNGFDFYSAKFHSNPKKPYSFEDAYTEFEFNDNYNELGVDFSSSDYHVDIQSIYNDRASVSTTEITVNAIDPLSPMIVGNVTAKFINTPVAGATVQLYSKNVGATNYNVDIAMPTDINGNFEFKNLSINKIYKIAVTKSGYIWYVKEINSANPLKNGQKSPEEILLVPASRIKGKIKNENGVGIDVHVSINGGTVQKFTATTVTNNNGFFSVLFPPTTIDIQCPTDKVRLLIEPINESYEPIDTTINVNQTIKDIGTLTVKKSKRRAEIKVFSKSGFMTNPIAGAKVVIQDISDTLIADNNGVVKYAFTSSGNNNMFKVYVAPPADKYFVAKTVSLEIKELSEFQNFGIELKKATFVSGYVTVSKAPLKNATVRLETGNPDETLITKTNQQGFYLIPNVPIGKTCTLKASQPQSQIIGGRQTITTQTNGNADVNFSLKIYNDMDITKILGFPMAVDSLNDEGGAVRIWGYLCNIPSNANVKLENSSTQTLPFSNLSIIKGALKNDSLIPYAYPVNGKLISDASLLNVLVNNKIKAKVTGENNQPLNVEEIEVSNILNFTKKVTGGIKGALLLKSSSYQVEKLSFNTDIRLSSNAANPAPIYPFNALGWNIFDKNGIKISAPDLSELSYTIHGFSSTVSATNSKLRSDTLYLNTTLHTNIANILPNDMALNIGNIAVTPTWKQELIGKTPINIQIQKWQIQSSDWSLSTNGFYLNSGKLNMNGTLVPFTNIKLKPTEMINGTYNFSSLKFLNTVDLVAATGAMADLFYDNGQKSWRFLVYSAGNYCATVTGLPAIRSNDKILLEHISLYSNGLDFYKVSNATPKVRVYDVVDYKPTEFYVYSDFIQIPGLFDLGIPLVTQEYLSQLIYTLKPDKTLDFKHKPFNFGFTATAVTLDFKETDAQTLTSAGFWASGTIKEDPIFKFKARLFKTTQKTDIIVDPLHQTFDFSGGKSLKEIEGLMAVNSGNWSLFRFQGDVEKNTFSGASGRLDFTVKGDIELSDDSKISVSNTPGSFAGIKLTYDIPNKCLTGNLTIDKKIGVMSMNGLATARIDKNGWYFVSGGSLSMPGVDMGAVLLFGDYTLSGSDELKNTFCQFSYKNRFPEMFKTKVKGCYFGGYMALPVPLIPQIDVDFIVAKAKLETQYGANVSVGANFSDGQAVYNLDLEAFIHAELSFELDACIELSSMVSADAYARGNTTYNATTGDWKIDLSTGISNSGSVKLSDCLTGTTYFDKTVTLDYSIGVTTGNATSTSFYIK